MDRWPFDRVLDVRQAPSLKGGGLGIRYTCRIRGKEVICFAIKINGLWKNKKVP
jgi:hypothetical protein